MKSFLHFLLDWKFSDLHASRGQWTQIPTEKLVASQNAPAPNIDTELYDLLQKSYAYIGGHIDFKRPSDLPANHTIRYGIDLDGDNVPDALRFAKQNSHGTKWTGGATDGSAAGKAAYVSDVVKTLNTSGNFAEVSDALMHVLIDRHSVPCVQDQKQVESAIGKSVQWIGKNPDGKYPGYNGFYKRSLGGEDHMKILLGKPY